MTNKCWRIFPPQKFPFLQFTYNKAKKLCEEEGATLANVKDTLNCTRLTSMDFFSHPNIWTFDTKCQTNQKYASEVVKRHLGRMFDVFIFTIFLFCLQNSFCKHSSKYICHLKL